MAGVFVTMPFSLELVREISTDNPGLIIIALPLGMIIFAQIPGKIADAIGTRRPIIDGFAVSLLFLPSYQILEQIQVFQISGSHSSSPVSEQAPH